MAPSITEPVAFDYTINTSFHLEFWLQECNINSDSEVHSTRSVRDIYIEWKITPSHLQTMYRMFCMIAMTVPQGTNKVTYSKHSYLSISSFLKDLIIHRLGLDVRLWDGLLVAVSTKSNTLQKIRGTLTVSSKA